MKILVTILISAFLLVFSSCKKYDDGNNWSLRTEKGRLVKGSPWVFEKLEVNGVNRSVEFISDSAYFNKITFYKNHPLETDVYSMECVSNYHYSSGDFELTRTNTIKIILIENGFLHGYTYYDYGPIFLDSWIEWEITRLTMNEFQMKTTYNGNEYKLYLKSDRD